jgi:hypothetical protein
MTKKDNKTVGGVPFIAGFHPAAFALRHGSEWSESWLSGFTGFYGRQYVTSPCFSFTRTSFRGKLQKRENLLRQLLAGNGK